VTVLAQSRALHGVGGRRTGVGGLEGHLMLLLVLVDPSLMGGLFAPRGAGQCLRGGVCMLHLGKEGRVRDAGLVNNPAIWEKDWRAAQKAIFRGTSVPRQPW
jgi:hypothetical protein